MASEEDEVVARTEIRFNIVWYGYSLLASCFKGSIYEAKVY